MAPPNLLIDGLPAETLVSLPELEDLVVVDRPIVFSIGKAQLLAQFSRKDHVLLVEIAVVERGGEGVLSTLIETIETAAKTRHCNAIEWTVLARNCQVPNPKLMRVLETLGFEVRQTDTGSEFYWHRKSINDSLLRRGS